ncbi:MAG: DSD1 family PLP-dependent enzyme [Pirellulaceae bacterium]|nr:DSD1 family PLP-dependent enzyme [Pirellulaceae bacterium]
MPEHPAIGRPIEELDTPALLLDLDVCRNNLRRMASFFDDKPAKLRPHFKNHKCSRLAQMQVETGNAVGITCAQIDEAEALAKAGIDNVLIANQVVGQGKLDRLARLAEKCTVQVAVDHESQATAISAAAQEVGSTVGLLVEVDIGMGRCGVAPGEPALELAQKVIDLPHTEFRGIQAYEGHLVGVADKQERAVKVRESMGKAVATRRLLEENHIATPTISGCSSSTYPYSGTLEGVTEVQAGSYATMDWYYHTLMPEFDIALSILATVISQQADRWVLNVGVKSAGAEFGLPQIKHNTDVEIPFFRAEEHCVVLNAPTWRMGDTVEFLPSHCCSTCNLYPRMFVHQNGRVVDVWAIDGRFH